jgi:hypothetical protein
MKYSPRAKSISLLTRPADSPVLAATLVVAGLWIALVLPLHLSSLDVTELEHGVATSGFATRIDEPVKAALSNNSHHDIVPYSLTLPIVLSGEILGGFGNQIELILQHLRLANKFQVEYVFPAMLPRKGGSSIPASNVWDVSRLRTLLPGVHTSLPPACDIASGGKMDVLVSAARANSGIQSMSVDQTSIDSETVVLNVSRYALDHVQDFRALISGILSQRPERRRQRDRGRRTICVYLSAHTASADWKIAPYLKANSSIVASANRWPLSSVGLVHLRYDEQACGIGAPTGVDPHTHVCLMRTHVPGGRRGRENAIWVPMEEYASTLQQLMSDNGATSLYPAMSMYVPAQTQQNLLQILTKKGVTVATSASKYFADDTLNLVEREIALRCRFFGAEAFSTWSVSIVRMRNNDATVVWPVTSFEMKRKAY